MIGSAGLLAVEMSSLGYRTREPEPLEPERTTAVESIVAWHVGKGAEVVEMARWTYLTPDEFSSLYAPEGVGVVEGSNDRWPAPRDPQTGEVGR